jgi:hypothetical protein
MRRVLRLGLIAASLLVLTVPRRDTEGRHRLRDAVDPIHTFGEPRIGVDPQGGLFVSGPTGTGTQGSAWDGSVDGGHSYRVITPARRRPRSRASSSPASRRRATRRSTTPAPRS